MTKYVEYGVAERMLPGQAESGDGCLVASLFEGVLIAAVDGLGHGTEAAQAANVAISVIRANAGEKDLARLMEYCHGKMTRTRGVAMTMAMLDIPRGTLRWLGVGNVAGTKFHTDPDAGDTPIMATESNGPSYRKEDVLLRGGVIGHTLPPLRTSEIPLARNDILIFATDGIRSDFREELDLDTPVQAIADGILTRCGKDTDDALVLVVRILDGPP